MKKPIYLLPFIFIYRAVRFLAFLPFKLAQYSLIGLFYTIYLLIINLLKCVKYLIYGFLFVLIYLTKIIKFIYKIIKKIITGPIYLARLLYKSIKLVLYGFIYLSIVVYGVIKKILFMPSNLIKIIVKFFSYVINGFVYISYFIYQMIKYLFLGITYIFKPTNKFFAQLREDYKEKKKIRAEEAERKFQEKREEYIRKHAERLKKEEEIKNKRIEMIEERKKRKAKESEAYLNENVVIEKKKFSDRINDALTSFFKIPTNIKKGLVNRFNKSTFVRNMRNKKDMEREALLISFEGDEAERSNTKLLYEYVAKNPDGKIIKGYFDAYSKVEVHSFLLSEGFEVYSIKTNNLIRLLHGNAGKQGTKVKTKDLIFFLTQLSTYIKAGIPLVDSLKILARQFKSKEYQRIFRTIIYDLTMGELFSEALSKQGNSFPRLLINMVKASEMTGQLPEVLDDMAAYFTQTDKTRKQMVTAMIYPVMILVIALTVVVFILIFVIPRFVAIYASMDSAQIPAFTTFIINASNFLEKNILLLLGATVVFIFIFRWLYKNLKIFKAFIQWLLMHLPPFNQVIIYNEVTMFTKTFSSLLSHNVFITDTMEILNKITNNEIYKMLILDTITNLAKGEKISEAFKNHWAFPLPAYEMIVTGEKTGELPEMMSKVADYYQELHAQSVARIKTFIEPILIIFLTVVVGGIVLSIVVPMFNMYSALQG